MLNSVFPHSIYLLFCIIGLSSLIGSIILFQRKKAFLANCDRYPGHVVDIADSCSDGITIYAPIVKYKAQDGTTSTITGKVFSSHLKVKTGDSMTVLIDRYDPAKIEIAGFQEQWFLSIVLFSMGLFTLILSNSIYLFLFFG